MTPKPAYTSPFHAELHALVRERIWAYAYNLTRHSIRNPSAALDYQADLIVEDIQKFLAKQVNEEWTLVGRDTLHQFIRGSFKGLYLDLEPPLTPITEGEAK